METAKPRTKAIIALKKGVLSVTFIDKPKKKWSDH
jgi:hypothetical protein